MNNVWKQKVQEAGHLLLVFAKWVGCAIVCGLTVGGVATLFHYSIAFATAFRTDHPWLIWLLPAGGVLIALAYKLCGLEDDPGTNLVLVAVRTTRRLSILTAPLIFFATFVTHVFGGSTGREGAAIQLGGSMGEQFGRLFRLDDRDLRVMTMCGMSAAFAAIFGTPVTAAVFSMEVISVGIMHYAALIPCMLSASVGYWLAGRCGVVPFRYALTGVPPLSLLSLGRVLLLAALCAAVSILFCRAMHGAGRLYRRTLPNTLVRAAVGGALVIAVTLATMTRDYNGAGMDVISRALGGQARPEAFILKIVLTALTLGAGFKGGEIVPALFVGATFGNTLGALLGLSPSFGAGIGMVALFCGVTNCPLASLLLSVELFGAQGLLLFGIAVAASYVLSGYSGLYSEQKIVYSKLRPEYIDRKAE